MDPTLVFTDGENGWYTPPNVGSSNPVSIYHSGDGGRTWTIQYRGPYYASGFDFLSATVGWATLRNGPTSQGVVATGYSGPAASGPELLSTTDGGATWQPIVVRSPGFIQYVDFQTPSAGYGLTEYGRLIHTADGGRTWSAIASPVSPTDTVCVSPTRLWVAAQAGLFSQHATSSKWTLSLDPHASTWRYDPDGYIFVSCNGQAVVVSFPGFGNPYDVVEMTERSLDDGVSWTLIGSGGSLIPSTDSIGYVSWCQIVCVNGAVSFTRVADDSMVGESSLIAGSLSEQPQAGPFVYFLGDAASAPTSDDVWVVCVENNAALLFRSTDAGSTWSEISTLPD